MTQLEIHDFRSNHDLTVPLGGVTVLHGSNMSGKSNTIRAARWLFHNAGGRLARLARRGTTATSVGVTLDDGTVVTRRRTPQANEYLIDVPGQPRRVLGKVGNGPCPEVHALTGVAPVVIGGVTYDLHFQGVGYRSPLDIPPADFYNLLSGITGTAVVDLGAREGARALGEARRAVKVASAALEAAAATVASLEDATAIPGALQELQTIQRQHQELSTRGESLSSARAVLETPVVPLRVVEQAERVLQEVQDLGRAHEAAAQRGAELLRHQAVLRQPVPQMQDVVEAERVLGEVLELQARRESLNDAVNQLWSYRDYLEGCQRAVPDMAIMAQAERVLQEIQDLESGLAQVAEHGAWLQQEQHNLAWASGVAAKVGETLPVAEAELARAIADLGVCPLCGQDTRGVTHAH